MERTPGGRRRPPGGGERPASQTGSHRAVRAPGGGAGGSVGTPPPSDTSTIRRGGGGEAGSRTGGGMGLGAKFALFIALTVAIASSVLVIAAYYTAAGQMDDEIDQAGIRMSKVVGAYAYQTIQKHEATKDGADPLKSIADDLNKLFTLIPEGNQEGAKVYDKRIRETLKGMQEPWNANALESLGGEKADAMELKSPEIINIAVVVGSTMIAAKLLTPISLSNKTSRGTKDGVAIEEGSYSDGGRSIRVRVYKKPVLDPNGSTKGDAIIYLSARKIDDAKSAILTALMLPLFLACVIGAGIGFYLSTIVTKPLKSLMNDINMVSAGDLEHETKAQSTDEIGYLARTFNLMTKSLSSAHEAELENKAMEHELNIATEIQSNLLPHRIPKIAGYELGAYYRPSKEVGGDYYDFIQIDQNHLGIIVADVSGKGIPGSMVMTMARSLIRMEAERNLSTADTLVKTNRILARDIRRGMFVTCLYALLDVRSRTLLVSSAGHNPMVVFRKATGKYELVNPNGIALGFDKGPIFERTIKEQQIQLGLGDRICLYTDGVVESMDSKNVEFGDERFYKMVQLLAEKDSNVFINAIVRTLDEHQGESPQHDDITIVTVRLLPQA
ncbi:MAG: SpoIIE family protein phosphatase [Planctomycetes bacterium]|nr:SpoIIE family protein phosphatase [Planctomycetota bacterium]